MPRHLFHLITSSVCDVVLIQSCHFVVVVFFAGRRPPRDDVRPREPRYLDDRRPRSPPPPWDHPDRLPPRYPSDWEMDDRRGPDDRFGLIAFRDQLIDPHFHFK